MTTSTPAQAPAVPAYFVVRPGVDPSSVDLPAVDPVKLGWGFSSMERGDLIDTVAKVAGYMKALEKWESAAREVLKATLPVPEHPGTETVSSGRMFEAHYSKSVRADIDREKVKTEMGEEWYRNHCKITEILMLKLVPITQSPGVPLQ